LRSTCNTVSKSNKQDEDHELSFRLPDLDGVLAPGKQPEIQFKWTRNSGTTIIRTQGAALVFKGPF
jgi:hypothetical protein